VKVGDSALVGVPEDTPDEGLFEKKGGEGEVWAERAEDGSLEEEWVREGAGEAGLAMVKGRRGVFVVAGGKFGFADKEVGFGAGSTDDWRIKVWVGAGEGGRRRVGDEVGEVLGGVEEWKVMEGRGDVADGAFR
jgi:hypothetical protein